MSMATKWLNGISSSLGSRESLIAVISGLAVAGCLRIGLAFLRGIDRTEAVMITLTTFALALLCYSLFSRSTK